MHVKFILFAILFFATAVEIFAAEGDLDASFDGDGIVITDNDMNDDSIRDLLVLPDGKIIAVGTSLVSSSSSRQAVIVRYNSNGSIDSTFGTNGKIIISSVDLNESALLTNGKIVLVGFVGTSPTFDFYVARLNPDGSFDTTFNGTGAVILDLRATSDSASSVKIQTDGKIVVGGRAARTSSGSSSDFSIVRLNSDGSLDTTFDGDGKVFTPLQETAGILSLTIQPDGKIVAVGEAFMLETSSGNPIGSFATVRYNPNGSVDTTFNGNGIAFTQFVSNGSPGGTRQNTPDAVIVRTGGKILVVGTTSSCCGPQPLSQVAMIQYNPDGSLDSSFGIAGKTQIGFSTYPTTSANDAAIQADNKIVITGFALPNINASLQAVVGRFNANGWPDPTFSGDGWNTLQIPDGSSTSGGAVGIQPDGKVLIGGRRSEPGAMQDFIIARFEASPCNTVNCAGEKQNVADFDGDGKSDLSVFRNGTWFINPSGSDNPNSFFGVPFGLATDKLTPADFDGDGKTDITVWRENVSGSSAYFYILQSSTNSISIAQFGQTGDDPRVVGDWDGDGKADLAVYRNGASAGAQSFFFYRPSTQPTADFVPVYWGIAGDEAARGDFDGDGRMDATVFRASDGIWYVLQSSNAQPRYAHWGVVSDKRVAGDFDGDGKTDFAVFRDGVWYVLQSSNNQPRYAYWGLNSDRLVAGDYDGDGLTDFAVWRSGVYYILQNSNAQTVYQYFGVANDIPVASAFVK